MKRIREYSHVFVYILYVRCIHITCISNIHDIPVQVNDNTSTFVALIWAVDQKHIYLVVGGGRELVAFRSQSPTLSQSTRTCQR